MVPKEKGMKTSAFFSATFPEDIQQLGADLLKDYVFMAVGMVGSANSDVIQTFHYLDKNQKIDKVKLSDKLTHLSHVSIL